MVAHAVCLCMYCMDGVGTLGENLLSPLEWEQGAALAS